MKNLRKFGLLLLIFILMFGIEFLLISALRDDPAPLIPSREPWHGFEWKEISGHGMRLLVQESEMMGMVVMEDGFAIRDESGVRLRPEIEFYEKKVWESPENLINAIFIKALTKEAQEGCSVVPFSRPGINTRGVVDRFTIAPVTEKYRKFTEEQMRIMPGVPPCGSYGIRDAVTYFEYHKKRPGQLLFVRVGQDAPIFDENSLRVE